MHKYKTKYSYLWLYTSRKCVTLSNKSKTRVSVTMTRLYIDSLDLLVEQGIYLGRGDAILEALRGLFKGYGVDPFYLEAEEPESKVSKI